MRSFVSGYVLAGGASRRMGRDKSLLDLGGTALAARAAATLGAVVPDVTVVGKQMEGYRWLDDPTGTGAGRAAIFGALAALRDAKTEWLILLACDLPFVTSAFIEMMLDFCQKEAGDAIVPVQPDGRAQPLAAVYRTSSCLAAAERMVKQGDRRLKTLVDQLKPRWVHSSEYTLLDGASRFFLNLNTPEDLEEARRIVEKG